MCIQNNDITCFDSFEIEHTPKEIKTFVGNKTIKINIFRLQACDSRMCEYVCMAFIDFMPAKKALTDFTSLFSPNNCKGNDDAILMKLITYTKI